MPISKTTLSYLVLAFCLMASLASAQSNNQIKLQFITFPVYEGEETLELLQGSEDPVTVQLPTARLSPVYTLENLNTCILGQSNEDETGDDSFVKFGETAALNSKEVIILVTRKGDSLSDGLELTPFNADQNGLSGGKYLIINASKVDIAGQVGEEKFLVRPNQQRLIDAEPSRIEGDRKYLKMKMFFRKGNSASPFYSNIWRHSDRIRCLIFIYHDPHTRQLRTSSIRDFI